MTIQKLDGTIEEKEITDYIDTPVRKGSKARSRRHSLEDLNKNTTDAIEENYRKLSKPIILTNFFVNHPFAWLFIVLLALGTLSGLVFYLGWFAVNPVNSRDFLIWDDPKTINYDKSTLARSMLVSGGTGANQMMPL